MVNTDLIKDKIIKSGKKNKHLAGRCSLSRTGFYNCLINKAEFKPSHIEILCDELNITSLREKEAIFFAKSVA